MVLREPRHIDCGRVRLQGGLDQGLIVHQVRMRYDDALRLGGGARGVLQERHFFANSGQSKSILSHQFPFTRAIVTLERLERAVYLDPSAQEVKIQR